MPRHVDTTANVERTHEELLHVAYSIDEVTTVVSGYPELDNRLYVPHNEALPVRRSMLLGHQVNLYEIPGGYDATQSSYRASTLRNMGAQDFLYGEPDPDMPTGGDWKLPSGHATVRRALRDRCRDFDQHNRPLVPGWRSLLALRAADGRPLGMPTGIGWYTHLWLSDMCDATTMRLSPDGDDVEVLLYKRDADNQSEWVWATPGGYVIMADAQQPGVTPLQAASARRTKHWAQRDVTAYTGAPLRVKYPISSGNTLHAGLRTTPFARFVPAPDYEAEPSINRKGIHYGAHRRAAGFVSVRSLCDYNPSGGVSGVGHGQNPFPIWTTHFEYVAAGLDAITDPEHQYRFGMSDVQFGRTQAAVADLRRTYQALRDV
ncbi:MAG TPA: hypothetical protein VLI54_00105 [Bacillota bacterium]|nr:hypothetical protein [Bacillota bacterium]